jgi:plastocyanin
MRLSITVFCGLLIASGCSDATMPTSEPLLVHAARVRAVNFRFIEPATTIPAGDTIYFAIANGTHSVHFDTPGAPDSVPSTPASAIAKRRFPTAGTYNFHCSRHGSLGMQGVITVTP